jgi:hypothetical protein
MDPEKLKELCPKRFHRKESLFPGPLPHASLRELLISVKPGVYDEYPCKGRGHTGTVIRVWRRHVNVADRLQRRREIKALWQIGIRAVLGEQRHYFDFEMAEHEAYIIFYCVGCRLSMDGRRIPTVVPTWSGDLPDDHLEYVDTAVKGYLGPGFDINDPV